MSSKEDSPEWIPVNIHQNKMILLNEYGPEVLTDKENENAIKQAMYDQYGSNSQFFNLFKASSIWQISILIGKEFGMTNTQLFVTESDTIQEWFKRVFKLDFKELFAATELSWTEELSDEQFNSQLYIPTQVYSQGVQSWIDKRSWFYMDKNKSPYKVFTIDECKAIPHKNFNVNFIYIFGQFLYIFFVNFFIIIYILYFFMNIYIA